MPKLAEYNNKPKVRDIAAKMKHVQACLLPESQYVKSAGFEEVELTNNCAASLNLGDISLATSFCGHNLAAPLMIAPMTGGSEQGAMLNQRWARAAQKYGIAMGVGSQRVALENHEAQKSFMVRKLAPDAFIFANIGAAQLLAGYKPEHALKAVRMIEANALFIHINPLQEACQEFGDVDFIGLLEAIELVVSYFRPLNIPVFAREVGFGLNKDSIEKLLNTGVTGLDCAGAGGTSWAKVEAMCAVSDEQRELGQIFGEWGIKTCDSLLNVRNVHKTIPLIATGGIRNGIQVAKSLALGANLAAMAQPMLQAAMESEEKLNYFIEKTLHQTRVAMFACGAKDINSLSNKATYLGKNI